MKTFTLLSVLAAAVLSASSSQAKADDCTGYTSSQAAFVNGTCSGQFCNATIPSIDYSANGTCPAGVSFSATAYAPMAFINGGMCQGGFFTGTVSAIDLDLSGTCSNGKSFSGVAYLPTSFVNGSCNGVFINATVMIQEAEVQGSCN